LGFERRVDAVIYRSALGDQNAHAVIGTRVVATGSGARNPEFRADLCKAKKVQVRGSFDFVQDLLSAMAF
jgi:hypothetical protein